MADGNLIPLSPLMQPVIYDGQEYFTSHYFHQQYLAHSQMGGKHRRHENFLRIIRAIEAFPAYIEQGDIIELTWEQVKSSSTQHLSSALAPLFAARGYQKLYLLNATAQAALSHHLDDELSKQMSVAINTTISRQATRKTADLLPQEIATRQLSTRLDAGKLLGVPLHISQQEAVKAVLVDTGVDFRPLLLAAPAQDNIPEEMLEPTDLAKALGWGTGRGAEINKHLEALGWQIKNSGGKWEPTALGSQYCTRHAWMSNHGAKSGYNLKWQFSAVNQTLGAKA